MTTLRFWPFQRRGRYYRSASSFSPTVLPEKFLNKIDPGQVFMIEGRRVVAGEAILSRASAIDRVEEERSLIERANAERRDAALEGLVREHSRLVYRIAFSVLRRHHDAEDATQETFLRVLRYSSKLDAVEDAKTWLARIAWRVANDRNKRLGSKREIALEDPETPVAEPASSETAADESVHGTEIEAALEKLIAALPEKLRQPLVLSAIEEMSPREVAATLGVNEAAVRSRVFRARQILKEKLAGRMGAR
jgi:RNA polymerase sigma-70 factor, ECF subfamily